MKLLIATTNKGKKKELLEAFHQYGLSGIEFLSLRDVEVSGEADENAETFEENALIKAKFFANQSGLPTLGEDSGLILTEFPEKFGVRTRREIDAKTDQEWLDKFIKILENAKDRSATFYSAIAFFDPTTKESATFLGTTSGRILKKPQAELEPGIPVSAIFLADGKTKLVYSALSREEKNEISHRGKSVKQLISFLQKKFDV
jgi:XTP/dITP diphosphohydrolase